MRHIPQISDRPEPPPTPAPRKSEPIFNLPRVVVVLLVIMACVHLLRMSLSFQDDLVFLAWFAFIPARFSGEYSAFPGGVFGDVWTFVSYAFLHGSWLHLFTNGLWMCVFGSAVARRFGTVRFLAFCTLGAVGGAAAHLIVHAGDVVPVVGASAAIAALMAGAARFVFDRHSPLRFPGMGSDERFQQPARPLGETFANRAALTFIALFFIINLATGVGTAVSPGVSIAWEAHIGGFLVGLFAFRFLDPIPPAK